MRVAVRENHLVEDAQSSADYSAIDYEELLNAFIHWVGFLLLAMAAFPPLMYLKQQGSSTQLAICAIYFLSMLAVLGVSTLFHCARFRNAGESEWKATLERLDHTCITIAIVGTYTPLGFSTLPSAMQIPVLCGVWAFAFFIITLKWCCWNKFEKILPVAYTCMVWSLFAEVLPFLPESVRTIMTVSVIFYSVGGAFFIARRVPYNHAIWHLMVVCGAACNYIAVINCLNIPTI